ncbi:PhoPQ-activated pathogenicity-related family protein [Flavilitoribacter nigricans]|uniref:PhoPQ-activated pathogenicity-like protein PqaA type n=1 Tax=Flavilitoribacter nigricans (strain ATCC 23147 / DSM 23189 / NBRC 102662 / NCIMB 1420 / SS-2) TaxID=1122177 RepID=A0A2D0N9V7_FLAN2|nr:PhoPQ-activated pathogenicity-related family protein [Flavilitoribacter nigricans]PHN05302.1 PhoPQ-activated pathogenicity-like protein PqaA type [Flavilitoribacter nigricans DSM 23189 = NBRC 102662]
MPFPFHLRTFSWRKVLFLSLLSLMIVQCREVTPPDKVAEIETAGAVAYDTPLDRYVHAPDTAFRYSLVDTLPGEGFTTYIVRMVSQRWMTEAEVKDPVWWHWLTIVVPDNVQHEKGLLFIGGGSRTREQPEKTDEMAAQIALASQSVVTALHNVPNQPTEFVGDDYGPRKEDELIAYGWRKFLELGGTDDAAIWLARFPMTKAAVRAMDVVSELSESLAGKKIDEFVVAGGSKRGWTTWTAGAVDDRVVGIVPIVIDMLNLVPSFEHHWKAYGAWAPAVGNYVEEGIMDWMGTQEFEKLLEQTEPFSFRERYDLPKLVLNATGDQFFLPDSWQFYWNDLPGEKHLRYVPNSEHSMRETDAMMSLVAFYQDILTETPRPEFDWSIEEGAILIRTTEEHPPQSITLWQAHNPDARDFRVEIIGRAWTSTEVPLREDGTYRLEVNGQPEGYTAFYGELAFPNGSNQPLKLSTGVVVTPDTYPHQAYVPQVPSGATVLGDDK